MISIKNLITNFREELRKLIFIFFGKIQIVKDIFKKPIILLLRLHPLKFQFPTAWWLKVCRFSLFSRFPSNPLALKVMIGGVGKFRQRCIFLWPYSNIKIT